MNAQSDPVSAQFDRLPPHDPKAEADLLSALFRAYEQGAPLPLPTVRARVTREAFFLAEHQIIFDAICHLHDEQLPTDPASVRAHLLKCGMLDLVGGTQTFVRLYEREYTSAQYQLYLHVVEEHWNVRRLIKVGHDVLRWANSPKAHGDSASRRAMALASAAADIGTSTHAETFRRLGDVAEEAAADALSGVRRFIPTGIRSLDDGICGLPIGGITMVGGRPGMGKSELLKVICGNIASGRATGERVGVAHISIEEVEGKIAINRISSEAGIENHLLAFARVPQADRGKVAEAVRAIKLEPYYVTDKALALSEVEAAIAVAVVKHGVKVVAVDYLQLIDPESDGGKRNDEVTRISSRLKGAMKRHGAAGLIAVQLNRGNESERIPPPPSLKNLRDSGSLEQDGDVIILLHAEDYYRKTEADFVPTHQLSAIVAKNKSGRNGAIRLHQSHATQTITDWEDHHSAVPVFD